MPCVAIPSTDQSRSLWPPMAVPGCGCNVSVERRGQRDLDPGREKEKGRGCRVCKPPFREKSGGAMRMGNVTDGKPSKKTVLMNKWQLDAIPKPKRSMGRAAIIDSPCVVF